MVLSPLRKMDIGIIEIAPSKSVSTVKQSGGTTTRYENVNKSNNYNKQSGGYERVTSKETYSSGDYSNRGQVGYKNEYQTSSTVKVGDKSGYTEYYKQERVTRVDYNSGSSSSSSSYGGSGIKGYKSYGGGKKYLN